MGEEITTSETVKQTSDGMVKISLEKYEELNRLANEPKVYPSYTSITKTPAMRAADNQMYGALLMGGGLCMTLVGGIQLLVGLRQAKAL